MMEGQGGSGDLGTGRPLAWVVGSGGLLGSALLRALADRGTEHFRPPEPFVWENAGRLDAQLEAAVRAFASALASRASSGARWELYWAAGIATMGSSEEGLAPETRALTHLLRLLAGERSSRDAPGAVALASSAGAIYAGSNAALVSEETPPAPNTAYARAKLEQEELVTSFALQGGRTTALLARLSTLYGPGQARGKPQGLIAHIARSVVRNLPVQIYVPLDTVRDYIAADDAAAAMIAALRARSEHPGARTRIIASERPTTIAEIVGIFRRVARRAPRIVTSASRLSALYPRRMQFRSVADPATARPPQVGLLVGIGAVMAAERAAFARGAARDSVTGR